MVEREDVELLVVAELCHARTLLAEAPRARPRRRSPTAARPSPGEAPRMDRRCLRVPICSWFASGAARRSAPTSPSAPTAATGCAAARRSCHASTRPERTSHRTRLPVPSLGRLRRGEIAGVRGDALPYATVALVAVSCVLWVLTSGGYVRSRPAPRRGAAAGRLVEALHHPVRLPERFLRRACTPSSALLRRRDLRLAARAPPRPLRGARRVLRRRRHRCAGGARRLPAADRQRRQRRRARAARGVGGARPSGRPRRGATTTATCSAPR